MKTTLNPLFFVLTCISGLALPASVIEMNSYEKLQDKNNVKTHILKDTIPPVITCKPLDSINWNDPGGPGPGHAIPETRVTDFIKSAYDNETASENLLFTFNGWRPQFDFKDDVAGNAMSINHPHFFNALGGVASAINPNTSNYKSALTQYQLGNLQLWIPSSKSSAMIIYCTPRNTNPEGNLEVQVTAWDQERNFSSCISETEMDGVCDDGINWWISGKVKTESEKALNAATILIDANAVEFPRSVNSNPDGKFQKLLENKGVAYYVSASKNDDAINGVSTLDLALIQRHILGIKKFDNPYKLIAADVNNDRKVSASDLTQLRQLILGVLPGFKNNNSWRFPIKSASLSPASPFPFPETIIIDSLNNHMNNLDFVAVKIGDVSGNATTDIIDNDTEARNNRTLVLAAEDLIVGESEWVSVPITATDNNEFLGFQFTLSLNHAAFGGILPGLLDVDEMNLGIHPNGILTMSYASGQPVSTRQGDVLFSLLIQSDKAARVSEMLTLSSDVTVAESYDSKLETNDIRLDIRKPELDDFELYQNEPNPFTGQTSISFSMPRDGKVSLRISDLTGKVIEYRSIDAVRGVNTETFNLEYNGMLFYTLQSEGKEDTKKMMAIK
jgi:hypothetical protein